MAQKKRDLIELQKVVAITTAATNPDKAAQSLRDLMETMFPEMAAERKVSAKKAMSALKKEVGKVYNVKSLDKRQQGLVRRKKR